jgi:hypothetical protein
MVLYETFVLRTCLSAKAPNGDIQIRGRKAYKAP